MLKPLLVSTLETLLNQYLSLDKEVYLLLAPIAKKVIAIRVLPFAQTFYVCPTKNNIQLLEHYTAKVDATISGTLPALGLMGLNVTPIRTIFNREVSIEGDTQTAHQLQQLFAKLDIDIEEHMAYFAGDIVAHKINNLLKTSLHWTQDSITTLKTNSKEFLQEEARDLPATAEADIFYQQIDAVRADFDRLLARIEQLQC